MMDFTFEGVVRHGFGFYNPNHAAALICAFFPFLWGWKKRAWIGVIASVLLAIPLAMTFSRTGVLVLFLEIIAYWFWGTNRNFKWIAALLVGIIVVFAIGGIFYRFTLDRAVTNRPQIWIAGLKLCAANPLGVGLGCSGMLASAFLLDGIECRTLINSHLTLWAEQGILVAFLWFSPIIYALINIKKHLRTGIAFAGLCISASCSSIFDWSVLLDFYEHAGLGLMNFILAWTMMLFFVLLWGILSFGKIRWQRMAVSSGIAALIVSMQLFFIGDSPRIRNGSVVRDGTPQVYVAYDDEWTLKSILPMLPDGYVLPLRSLQFMEAPVDSEVWLFGATVESADRFQQQKLVLVDPPEFFKMPPHVTKVMLPHFPARTIDDVPIEYY